MNNLSTFNSRAFKFVSTPIITHKMNVCFTG